jgi:hypothetical protein
MKKEEETPDFTGVSLCTLFSYLVKNSELVVSRAVAATSKRNVIVKVYGRDSSR